MGQSMSIGQIGNETIVFKRQFRWTFAITSFVGDGSVNIAQDTMWYAKTANRPTLNFDETEINHLHEKHWLSGKPVWETLGITLYDVKYDTEIDSLSASERALHLWLNHVFNFSTEITPGTHEFLDMGDHDAEYKADLTLRMLDGHGQAMETWWILGAWPQNVNWGSLDYSSSDTADVEFTLRYDRARFFPGRAGSASGGAGS